MGNKASIGLVRTPGSLLHDPSSEVQETQPRHCLTRTFVQSFLVLELDGYLSSLPGNAFLEQEAAGLISADWEVGVPSAPIVLESKRSFATAVLLPVSASCFALSVWVRPAQGGGDSEWSSWVKEQAGVEGWLFVSLRQLFPCLWFQC